MSLQQAQPRWTGLSEESDDGHSGNAGNPTSKKINEAYTRKQRCSSRSNAVHSNGPMTGVGQKRRSDSELAAEMISHALGRRGVRL